MAWRSVAPPRWPWILLLGVALLLTLRLWQSGLWATGEKESAAPLHEGLYRIVQVLAGDTLLVAPQEAAPGAPTAPSRVRLLGVACLEPSEAHGAEAVAFTRAFVRDGIIRIRLDTRRQDEFERAEAYVLIGEESLNEALLRAGLARLTQRPSDNLALQRQLRQAYDEAVAARRGIWATETPAAAPIAETSTAEE